MHVYTLLADQIKRPHLFLYVYDLGICSSCLDQVVNPTMVTGNKKENHVVTDALVIIGVPRILENTLPAYLESSRKDDDDDDDDDGWKLFGDYMSTARINLNIRQVFPLEYQ